MRNLILIIGMMLSGYQMSRANSCDISRFSPTIDTNRNDVSYLNNTIDLNKIEYKTKTHFQYAILLNLPVEMIDNLPLYNFISDWLGTKYKYGGNSKNGTDCSGFVQQLLKTVFCVAAGRSVTDQFAQCQPVQRADLQIGDLVFFHTTRPGLSHVGFYLGNDKFVHSGCNKGVVIDALNQGYYNKAFRIGGRIIQR